MAATGALVAFGPFDTGFAFWQATNLMESDSLLALTTAPSVAGFGGNSYHDFVSLLFSFLG